MKEFLKKKMLENQILIDINIQLFQIDTAIKCFKKYRRYKKILDLLEKKEGD